MEPCGTFSIYSTLKPRPVYPEVIWLTESATFNESLDGASHHPAEILSFPATVAAVMVLWHVLNRTDGDTEKAEF